MPRRDGLPTNREMVVEFNDLSRTAFVDAYNRTAEDGLPDAYQDKPLDALYLRSQKRVPEIMRIDGGVVAEELLVNPLHEDDVDMIPHTLGFRDTPEDVISHYRAIARRIGDTTLHSGLDIATVLPPEGVDASYTAYYAGGRTRHIATFKEKPSKASIAAGKYFAEQVIHDINAPSSDPDIDVTDLSQVAEHLRQMSEQGGTIEHFLSFRKVPNLPLNGHESRAFLNAYANRMLDSARYNAEKLAKMRDLGAPDIVVASVQNVYNSANASYLRAQELLDKK